VTPFAPVASTVSSVRDVERRDDLRRPDAYDELAGSPVAPSTHIATRGSLASARPFAVSRPVLKTS
jgi:hypothetical protein